MTVILNRVCDRCGAFGEPEECGVHPWVTMWTHNGPRRVAGTPCSWTPGWEDWAIDLCETCFKDLHVHWVAEGPRPEVEPGEGGRCGDCGAEFKTEAGLFGHSCQ